MPRYTFNPIVQGQPAWQRQLRDRHIALGICGLTDIVVVKVTKP